MVAFMVVLFMTVLRFMAVLFMTVLLRVLPSMVAPLMAVLPAVAPLYVAGERHIPYIMFWPNTTRNKLAAWAGNQQPNGMLAEQIHNADPDKPEGRVMADSTSMFICYILELLRWPGER